MTKKNDEKLTQMMADLQRVQADFENYRKRVEQEKDQAREAGKSSTIMTLLPVVDNIERAISHMPPELANNSWAQGVVSLVKNLEKSLTVLNVKRIEAVPGTVFNPMLHEAIQMNEDAEGEHEVVAEELQAGYIVNGVVARPALVKVTKR